MVALDAEGVFDDLGGGASRRQPTPQTFLGLRCTRSGFGAPSQANNVELHINLKTAWHEADFSTPINVRFEGQSGHRAEVASMSAADPKRT